MSDVVRPDLAAMTVRLSRALMAAEEPVLAAHGITMWAYAVLTALVGGPASSQQVLAERIGADKTRIIPTLDALQQQGLLDRVPDPEDRRLRTVTITPAGRQLQQAVCAQIQRQEEAMLTVLPPARRREFLAALQQLSALPSADLVDRLRGAGHVG